MMAATIDNRGVYADDGKAVKREIIHILSMKLSDYEIVRRYKCHQGKYEYAVINGSAALYYASDYIKAQAYRAIAEQRGYSGEALRY